MHIHVAHLLGRGLPVDRRVDDGVVEIKAAFLRLFVPGLGVLRVGAVKLIVRAERAGKGGLVIRRAPHPAIAHARPTRDGVPRFQGILRGAVDPEKPVRKAAIAGIGRAGQHIFLRRVVQRVIHAGNHARGIAERRMAADILDTLAINIDLAIAFQRVQIFGAVHRPHIIAGSGKRVDVHDILLGRYRQTSFGTAKTERNFKMRNRSIWVLQIPFAPVPICGRRHRRGSPCRKSIP
jgi:hypothetical protein